jgi:hypothetical protein
LVCLRAKFVRQPPAEARLSEALLSGELTEPRP